MSRLLFRTKKTALHRSLFPEEDRLQIGVKLQGQYKLEAVHASTGKIRELTGWFDNLITDAGLNYMMTNGSTTFTRCMVGTGTTAPTNSNTTMQTQVAFTSNTLTAPTSANLSTLPYWVESSRTWQFLPGAAAGNLTEVGAGWDSTSVFSRSLIKDSGGTPIAISVLADEYLNVTYRLRVYPSMTDASYNVTISGTTYAVVLRTASLGIGSGWGNSSQGFQLFDSFFSQCEVTTATSLGTVTSRPSGGSSSNLSGASVAWDSPYVPGSFTRNLTLTIPPATANLGAGSFRTLYLRGDRWPESQILFTPAMPKTSTQRLKLYFTFTWGRL